MAIIAKTKEEKKAPPIRGRGSAQRQPAHQWRTVPAAATQDFMPKIRVTRSRARKPPTKPHRLIWTPRDEEILQAMQPPPLS